MIIFEINIGGETFVSSESNIDSPIDTQLVESNIYGMRAFIDNKFFYHFTENGPKSISRPEMLNVFRKVSIIDE